MSVVPDTAHRSFIVAKASRDYRWRRYALALVLLGYGIYSYHDGFYKYPRENAEDRAKGFEVVRHPGFDVQFNQAFGLGLPPLSLVFLGWVWYASRGQYEYDGETLKAPGHGAVPVKSIRKIDRSKWDRKGIAYLHYLVPGNANLRVLKLDDFIYDRKPTDEIFKHVAQAVEAGNRATAVNAPVPGSTVSS